MHYGGNEHVKATTYLIPFRIWKGWVHEALFSIFQNHR